MTLKVFLLKKHQISTVVYMILHHGKNFLTLEKSFEKLEVCYFWRVYASKFQKSLCFIRIVICNKKLTFRNTLPISA